MIRLFRDFGAAVALFLPLAISTEGFSAVIAGKCQPNEVKYAASSLIESDTQSETFVIVPEATINFSQGGTKPSCVIVHFSGHAFSPVGNTLVLRAVLNNTTAGLPAQIQFTANDPNFYTTRTAIFIFHNVPPGTHQIKMQFRSGGGDKVEIGVHNTLVNYTR
jgi:hypothetical protein